MVSTFLAYLGSIYHKFGSLFAIALSGYKKCILRKLFYVYLMKSQI